MYDIYLLGIDVGKYLCLSWKTPQMLISPQRKLPAVKQNWKISFYMTNHACYHT